MPSLVVQLSGPWLEHVQPCLHQLYVLKTTFSWRPLPSFSLLIIHDHLPSDSCRSAVGQVFSFFVVLAYAWLLFDPCFLVILADNLGGRLELAMTVVFVCVFLLLLYSVVRNTYNSLGNFFLRDEKTVVLPSHPLLVLNSRWGRAVISTYTLTCLFSSRSSMALASLGFCVIVPTVPSRFVDSPSLLQGKRCWFLVAFARRTDCSFAFTPTDGSQLSVGPRYDFDLHVYMFYLHLAVATFTRWLHGWLGTLRNRVSVVWFLCDRFFWFRRFTEFTSGQALLVFNGVWGNLTSCAPRA